MRPSPAKCHRGSVHAARANRRGARAARLVAPGASHSTPIERWPPGNTSSASEHPHEHVRKAAGVTELIRPGNHRHLRVALATSLLQTAFNPSTGSCAIIGDSRFIACPPLCIIDGHGSPSSVWSGLRVSCCSVLADSSDVNRLGAVGRLSAWSGRGHLSTASTHCHGPEGASGSAVPSTQCYDSVA